MKSPALCLELSFDITAREQASDAKPNKQPPNMRCVARDDSCIERNPTRERKARVGEGKDYSAVLHAEDLAALRRRF